MVTKKRLTANISVTGFGMFQQFCFLQDMITKKRLTANCFWNVSTILLFKPQISNYFLHFLFIIYFWLKTKTPELKALAGRPTLNNKHG
jgi:hypothetical protein